MSRIAVGVVSVALLAVAAGCAAGVATRVDDLENSVAALQSELEAMEYAIAEAQVAKNFLEQWLATTEDRSEAFVGLVESMIQDYTLRLRRDYGRLSSTLEAVQADVKELQDRMQEPAASPTPETVLY